MFLVKTAVVLLCFFVASLLAATPRPVVMWHGMGDNCCNPQSMGFIKKLIEKHVPGIYVYSIMLGDSPDEDTWEGFLGDTNKQIEEICQKIAADPKLKNGFNAVGFSQGGQFIRGYVERCNNPPVHNLISIGGQHQGVYGFPKCPGVNVTLCNLMREMLDIGAYVPFVQRELVQAQYWHDPFWPSVYSADCILMPDLNNMHEQKNATYKKNLASVNSFVMTKFLLDTMVQPRESEWFGFYENGQDDKVITMKETKLYQEDWIGLKELDQSGRLHFLAVEGDHLQFTEKWFIDQIISPYFNNTL